MKIGFAGRWSPHDKSAWSGIYYYSHQVISQQHTVEAFHYKWPFYVREYLLLHKQWQKLRGKRAAVEFLRDYARWFGKQLQQELHRRKVDVLFVPGAPQLVAYCKTDIPIVYMTDATFLQLQGYYPLFSGIADYNIRQGIELDKQTFQHAAHCMVTSDWARDSAIKEYGIIPEKLSIVPFGANLDDVPDISKLRLQRNKRCQLLFIGVEWIRKGGQIALDTIHELRRMGMDVQLTIVGCVPPFALNDADVTIIPFIDKRVPDEARRLQQLIADSDFLLLPTRAECTPLVFCEASAYGLPSISTNTGGVSSYVRDGINGRTLPLSAGGADYAAAIMELFADETAYRQLCLSSRHLYDSTLNWNEWGKSFTRIAEQVAR